MVAPDLVFFIDATSMLGLDVNNVDERIIFRMRESRLDQTLEMLRALKRLHPQLFSRLDQTLEMLRALKRLNPQLFRDEYAANQQILKGFLARIGSPLNMKQLPFEDQERFFDACVMILCFRQVVAGVPIPVIRGQEALDILAGAPGSEDPGLVGGHWSKSPFLRRLYALRKR